MKRPNFVQNPPDNIVSLPQTEGKFHLAKMYSCKWGSTGMPVEPIGLHITYLVSRLVIKCETAHAATDGEVCSVYCFASRSNTLEASSLLQFVRACSCRRARVC